ncbi:aldose 1-epimerase [Aquirufa regiilacus]|uniref:Aldose 1-epimerase n=1 Tax=Aquirufa regiilacus TaxID=3024868 RepID=A0ABU3TPU8_9BACT|nr:MULTISPECIES: aldose 1-epimerase [unclassified Aquirufa]MDT8887443.1 aldose 1-epimerase [Aquirufa sp. LEPPI-3A]MDU0807884.1 aldose 1-epimerase [Aquirufa sp. LEOWEIH-7C]
MEIVNIKSPDGTAYFEIIPAFGGMLTQLNWAGNVIKIPFENQFANSENPYHPSALLSPWVNRVRNGNYSFEGRNYQLPVNEPNLGNAIHGLLARMPFDISLEASKATLTYHYDAEEKAYPFPFEMQLSYSFSVDNSFQLQFQAKNIGSGNMPFACGWHPYFNLTQGNLADWIIRFDSISKFHSDSQMIPLREESFDASAGVDLGKEVLDNVFRLEPKTKHITNLYNKQKKESLYLEQSSIDFPFLVVFAPENSNCVAIEPMSANTDAFNTGDGLRILAPNEIFQSSVKIWYEKADNAV